MAVRSNGPDTGFLVCVHCDLDNMTLGQGHDTPLGHGQQFCEILSRSHKEVRSYGPDTMWTDSRTRWYLQPPTTLCAILSWSNMAMRSYGPDKDFCMCALWPWQYDLGSRSWHTLGSWTTIVWNTVQIGQGGKKLRSGRDINRQTGWFLHPQTKFVRGIIIHSNKKNLSSLFSQFERNSTLAKKTYNWYKCAISTMLKMAPQHAILTFWQRF